MKFFLSALTTIFALAAAPLPCSPLTPDENRRPPVQEPSAGSVAQADSVTIEGHAYYLIRVGAQTWLGENLRVTRDRNGDSLAWVGPEGMDKEGNGRGRLYDWEAARRAAPPGWRLPTVKDWQALILRLGGEPKCGRKLLLAGSGEFGALLVGGVDALGRSLGRGEQAVFWTAAETSVEQAFCLTIGRDGEIKVMSRPKSCCYPVRLLRDDPPEFAPLAASPGSR